MWKDITSYSRDDKERVPNVWELKAGRLRLVVVRNHIHIPDHWLASCYPLFQDAILSIPGDATPEQAQNKAISAVMYWLDSAMGDLVTAVEAA